MRFAIIGDVHSNIGALTSVLADIRRRAVDRIICLGDLVGYHSFPHETLATIRRLGIPSVQGNHDLMAVGRLDPADCGPNARAAILWTRDVLSNDEKAYLCGLPPYLVPDAGAICVHSRLGDPVGRMARPDHYLAQREVLMKFNPELRLCFTGHTHDQHVIEIDASGGVADHTTTRLLLASSSFYFINPGSVGHPRESDYRARYALHDTERRTVTLRRVAYNRDPVAA